MKDKVKIKENFMARQVFYVQDPCDSRLSVVLQRRPIGSRDQNHDSILDICDTPAFFTKMPCIIQHDEVDDVHVIRNDHDKGLWENIPT